MEPIVIQVGQVLPKDISRNKLDNQMRFHRASYDGGSDYKSILDDQNEPVLIAHENESEVGYKRRKRSATYHNHCKPIVQKFNNLVFSSPIVRDQSTGLWKEFVDDADMLRTDLASFIRKATLNAQIDGSRYAIFESSKSEDVITIAQAILTEARPFLIDVDPRNVMAERVVGNNRVLQILIRISKYEARLYDKTNITIISLNEAGYVTGAMVVPHGFDDTPVIKFVANDDAVSQLIDIAQVNKALFNLDALLSEELARQVFTQWFAAGLDTGSPDPTMNDVQSKPLQDITIGGRKLIATSNPNVSFTRLSGDSSQAESLKQAMLAKIEEIQRLSGMRDPKVQEASGRALKILFDEALMQAQQISRNAEHGENDVIDLFNDATGSSIVYTSYPPTFLSEDRSTDLDQVIKALQAELPPTLQEAFVEKLVSQHFADLSEEDKREIKRELEIMLNLDEEGTEETKNDPEETDSEDQEILDTMKERMNGLTDDSQT